MSLSAATDVGRPFVFLNAAMTADGKIAPAQRAFEPFGSRRDQALLLRLRARADAVMCGARTVDMQPITLGTGGPRYRRTRLQNGLAERPLRVIVSGSGSVDPRSPVFQNRSSPIIVLASARATAPRLRKLRAVADAVAVFGAEEVDFPAALAWLRAQWNVRRLLCEGGGELNGALFAARLVDELHLTVCPLILGGRVAPTLADGRGFHSLAAATPLELTAMRRAGNELFLTFRVRR